ncbi:MAG: aminopeptidase P family protein [Thermomicrobiales bacterium]|nr:aminopeptidase P family protein [Thermomicrobiales bacterium]
MTTPANDAVHLNRLRRAQAEMTQHGIDLLVVGPSPDLFYLIGYEGHESERMSVLVLPREGQAQYLTPRLEAALLDGKEDLLRLVTWTETEQPAVVLSGMVGDAATGTIAVNDDLWSVFLLRLQQAMPRARWVEAAHLLRPLRMRKDAAEVAMMAEVARRTDETWEEFITLPVTGLTELQAKERLEAALKSRGVTPSFCIVASGPHSASPHHHAGERVIQHGDALVVDWGGTLGGYYSDVTRSAHVGPASAEYAAAYAAVLAANEIAFSAVRPGVPCEEIDRAARDYLTARGYGEAFFHRVGHGLGLAVHEEPYLVAGNDLPLAEGMTFSDEPGVYFPGKFGIRIEDTVVVTADGGEKLNHATRALTILS